MDADDLRSWDSEGPLLILTWELGGRRVEMVPGLNPIGGSLGPLPPCLFASVSTPPMWWVPRKYLQRTNEGLLSFVV